MLNNINQYATKSFYHLKYTSRTVATPLLSNVAQPSVRAGFFMMQTELNFQTIQWKAIADYNGRYEISSNGRIFSYARKKEGKLLAYIVNKDGYVQSLLSINKIKTNVLVHRLVAMAFVPNPNNLPEVNHIDGDKTNNNYWNLEWTTTKKNIGHAWSTGLSTAKLGYKGNRGKPVKITTINGDLIGNYKSMASAHRKTGVSIIYIRRCCDGDIASTKGYNFKYQITEVTF